MAKKSEEQTTETTIEDGADDIIVGAAQDVETMDDFGDEVSDADLEEVADTSFSLTSPEMAAKIQTMHENLPLSAQIEAAIFASAKPLKADDLMALVSHKITVAEIEVQLELLRKTYEERQGGFTLEYVKSLGYQFQSSAIAAPIMAKMFATRPRPLSRAALETLAIIAYRQPCTRAAVEFIRGVDSGSIIKNLLERSLIKCVGRKEDAGRPMIFGTTDEFLQVFGIGSIKDLPPLSAFQPTSDTMKEALKELDQLDAVEVEDFVTDDEEAPPEFGAGLLAEELDALDAVDASEVPETVEGATLAEGPMDDPNPELLETLGVAPGEVSPEEASMSVQEVADLEDKEV